MAYYVFSALDANLGPGPLLIRAGVDPRHVDRAVASIDEELARMAASGLTAREIRESQDYLVGSLPRMLETNAGIASFLQTAEQFGLGLDYAARLPGLIRAVTLEEANAVARRFLVPERAAVVVAGPYSGTEARESSAPGLAASQ
jgi:zinc protease